MDPQSDGGLSSRCSNSNLSADVEECVRKKLTWPQLPNHVRHLLRSSQKEYRRYILEYSIHNQLRYRGNLVRSVYKDERRYYEALVESGVKRLMLFPYHLADMVVKGLRITPFAYYKEVVGRIMDLEKSYDTLPNFTAADCLRLLGVGRNEYMELMNLRGGRGSGGARRLLPALPRAPPLQPWWRLELGLVLEDDVKILSAAEREVIDRLIDDGSQTVGTLDCELVHSLYKKGLVYLDVPITGCDRVRVPPLQGFVMNRVTGDYLETLLYKVFVTVDESTAVSELAAVLQEDAEQVKQAVALCCRLGFAQRTSPQHAALTLHPSWLRQTPQTPVRAVTPLTLDSSLQMEPVLAREPPQASRTVVAGVYTEGVEQEERRGPRVAFLFDSTLTAYLMMGNLSPDLKNHAVTMFEVGKLCDESIDSFLEELDKIGRREIEGEAQRYWTHALVLRATLLALSPLRPLDLVRCESLQTLDAATAARLLNNKYRLLVAMAPLLREARPPRGAPCTPPLLGPAALEANSLWFKLFIYHATGFGPPTLLLAKGAVLERLPRAFLGFSRLLVCSWQHEGAVLAACNFSAVNATLQYGPVMLQAWGVRRPATTRLIAFPADPEDPRWNNRCLISLAKRLDLQHACGYVTLVDIGVPDWGAPPDAPSSVRLGRAPEPQPGPLSSPDERHFAVSPAPNGSPDNGITDAACSKLLRQELDRLDEQQGSDEELTPVSPVESEPASPRLPPPVPESLLSPTEESVSVFSQCLPQVETEDVHVQESQLQPEKWTLLDCNFGVPLFDEECNQQVCQSIVTDLHKPESLSKLAESNKELSADLLAFINQCQYYPGEDMELVQRGSRVPFPRKNLIFENGKISAWNGK